jgi:hypothetical protein
VRIHPETLPDGAVGIPYSQQLWSADGVAPHHFEILTGDLPPGLSLNSETGLLDGTLALAGTWRFTVMITDSDGDFPLTGVSSYEVMIAQDWSGTEWIYLPLVVRSGSAR